MVGLTGAISCLVQQPPDHQQSVQLDGEHFKGQSSFPRWFEFFRGVVDGAGGADPLGVVVDDVLTRRARVPGIAEELLPLTESQTTTGGIG